MLICVNVTDGVNLFPDKIKMQIWYSTGRPFVKEMEPMTLSAGSVAIIPCKYGGYPIDKIVWRKNGSEIDTVGQVIK